MFTDKIKKCLCCFDLTLASRLIGFVGVAVSVLLTTVLISDHFGDDYSASRKTALALGLDWQHFHHKANASQSADPNGKLISAIVVFYATIYLITSMILIFATITYKRWCTAPWLICELCGCVSKSIAMIDHAIDDSNHFSNIFVIGSVCYIALMFWWWMVVYTAQASWIFKDACIFHFSLIPKQCESVDDIVASSPTAQAGSRPPLLRLETITTLNTPESVYDVDPYIPNPLYNVI